MRLDVSPDNFAERLGLLLGVVPTPLIYSTFGPGYGRAIVAGARLGLYEALASGPLDGPGLAEATGCDPLGVEVLANALVGYGVLLKEGERFRHTPKGARWLTAGHDDSLLDAVLFMGWVQEQLMGIEDAVRTGSVERLHDREHPPEFWSSYLRGLASFARIASREIVQRVRVSPRQILDVGGGHGLYSQAFCRKHDARATVLDLAPACEVGRGVVEDERVSFREGDFRTADWGGPYDTVLVFNVTHNATEDEARLLFSKAAAALEPGGVLLVCDAAHQDKLGASEGWNELFFFMISGARAWPEKTLQGWAEQAGLRHEGTTRLWAAPSVVLRFTRPG